MKFHCQRKIINMLKKIGKPAYYGFLICTSSSHSYYRDTIRLINVLGGNIFSNSDWVFIDIVRINNGVWITRDFILQSLSSAHLGHLAMDDLALIFLMKLVKLYMCICVGFSPAVALKAHTLK